MTSITFDLINNSGSYTTNDTCTVYCYWDKGIDHMPDMIRRIYIHNINMSKKYNFALCLLTDENIKDYTYLPDRFWSLAPNFKSDIVRFFVLHKYGGIWLDTDIIIIKDLNQLYLSFLQSDKDVILDIEYGDKVGCASIIMRPHSTCSTYGVNYIINTLNKKESLGWNDLGPFNVTNMVKQHRDKIQINGDSIVTKGCNYICWNSNPGYNKKKWYRENEQIAKEISTTICNNNDCYYIITWSIYRKNNVSDIAQLVFDDTRSIFHHITNYSLNNEEI